MANEKLTKADVQKENFKLAVSVFLRTVLSAVLCIFVYMSFSMLITGLTTKDIGKVLYESDSSGNWVEIERHYYADDSSAPATKPQTPVGPGIKEETPGTQPSTSETERTLATNQREQAIRSEVPRGASLALDIISSVFMLILLASFPYSIVWSKGDRDKNTVNFGHMEEDKLRGLKVGLLSAIPAGVGYIVLLLSKLGVAFPGYIFLYRFINMPFMPIINAMTPVAVKTTMEVAWPAILGMLIVVIFVPLICHVAYVLGYKQISLTEKFIYKNPNKKKKRRW